MMTAHPCSINGCVLRNPCVGRCKIEWTARSATEKARARRMIKAGTARLVGTHHETYIRHNRLINYEGWTMQATDRRQWERTKP